MGGGIDERKFEGNCLDGVKQKTRASARVGTNNLVFVRYVHGS